MRCFLRLPFYILVLIALLAAGCTQPGTDLQKTVSTTPGASGSSVTGISPEAALSQPPLSASPAAMVPEVQKRGTPDPDFIVDISVPEKISPGTTILPDNHDAAHPRIIEINRLGEIIWEYSLSEDLKTYINPGWDVEMLPNGNILTLLPRKGVYEINRDKQVVWKYLDPKVSHDADRLPNGNTLIAFGASDTKDDAQVIEIDTAGNRVWSWHARDHFNIAPFNSISDEGWTHTNAVTRLANGSTLISLRNFNFIIEVDPQGNIVRRIGEGILTQQHDPLVLPNGNILVANLGKPQTAIELDPSGNIVWRFTIPDRRSWPARDVNRLPNGNTLITESDRIIEVTKEGQVVWQFRLATNTFTAKTDPVNGPTAKGFYKAERISA
jgi:hypothetical protein